MQILRIMWQRGEITVRDVHDAFANTPRRSSYTALATTMRTMVDKGIIRLTDARRPQKFEAVESEETTYSSIAQDVTRRVFGGSIANLVRSALSGPRHSEKEIADLRKLLDQLDTKADAKPDAKPPAKSDSSK
jgi:predicted transcriptional regulator